MSFLTTPTATDRLMKALRAIIRAEIPQLRFFGIYDYVINDSDGTTVDCSPADPSIGLPSFNKLEMISAVDGTTAKPPSGAHCRVVFLNADPTQPRVIGCDAPCTNVQIAGGGPAIAREGDSIGPGYFVLASTPQTTQIVQYFPGTPEGLAAATAAAGSMMPTGTVQTMSGVITDGSSEATCG